MTAPGDGSARERYQRIAVPGDDSTATDLWIALVIRVALLLLFTVSAALTTSISGRVFFAAGLLLWGILAIDTALTIRRRRG